MRLAVIDETGLALAGRLQGFVPSEVYDIHAHLYDRRDFGDQAWTFLQAEGSLGCDGHRGALKSYLPVHVLHGLYFGLPHATGDRPAINERTATEVTAHGTDKSRSLCVVAPTDDPAVVADGLRRRRYAGIKVYHCFAARPDTMQASIPEYAPEWMWEILDEVGGCLMLHLVREAAIADQDNVAQLRRLARRYPRAKVILAHVARSFNYRHGRAGLRNLVDLDNVYVDTSAITEAEAFRAALDVLGPRRVLWGSDFPVSELRGRCVTTADRFFWLHPEVIREDHRAPTANHFTLVGLESVLCLQEAAEDLGLTAGDRDDIFRGNAERLLGIGRSGPGQSSGGPELWQRARTVISGGTGLLSKRAEMFDPLRWPSFFSRAAGAHVWDLAGRRYVDFAGGIGAVLLGYADPDVTAAVRRRLSLGTYCTLVNPQEVELAEQLLALHPWAGKVRYARGGGEAMAVAVRTARAATGRSGIAFCGYHGWHDWYLAANLGASDALDGHLLRGLEPRGVPRELRGTAVPFKYNDLASFQAAVNALGANLAAVVMEPMRAQWPQAGFLEAIMTRCRAAGAVLVLDEVTSGLRYGFPGAASPLGLKPDLVVYAKAMSNGFPFGVVLGKEEIMASADRSFISSSYWTDGVGPAAALAVLGKAQRQNVFATVWNRGERLQEQLTALAAKHSGCRLKIGGMASTPSASFDLGPDASLALTVFVRRMQERGYLVMSTFYLMLAHDDADYAGLLAAMDETLLEIASAVTDGRLSELAQVERGERGFARLA